MIEMNKKHLRLCCLLSIVLFVFLTSFSFASASTLIKKERLYGTGRIQTAIEISKSGWASSDYVVLATANNYPDALCAAPLAKLYNAPLLLTEGGSLNSYVKAELQRLNVKSVVIVGGSGVVSDDVFYAVKTIANVERIAGSSREETSVEVAKKIGSSSQVVLATGFDFPDALSISSIAAAKKMPILLTGRDYLNEEVDKYIKNNAVNTTYIIGGYGAISASVEAKVPGAVRIAGADRLETNYAVLNKFSSEFDFSKFYIATARDYPDALAGSALAAMTSSPILLVDGSVSTNTKNLIKENANTDVKLVALGGNSVVADSVVDSISASFTSSQSDLKVASITSNGLNQVKVIFTSPVNKASAETPTNYQLNGASLSDADRLTLDADNKILLITLHSPMNQSTRSSFIVKDKTVLSEDNLKTVPAYEAGLTFIDVTVPVVKSVTATGNRRLIVEFSEAVKLPQEFIDRAESTLKLDGQYLANYNFNYAKALDVVYPDSYSSRLELNFNAAISSGRHTLTVPDGTSSELVDAANFRMAKSSIDFTVDTVYGGPRALSATGQTNGIVYITFDRSMDPITAEGEFLYKIGNTVAMAADFKPGTNNTVVRVVFGSGIISRGGNVLTIDRDIKDTNGNKLGIDDDVDITFNATDDKEKPTVQSISLIDNKRIRVKFSETIDTQYATNIGNYTLIDSNGVTLDYISSITYEIGGVYSDTCTINLKTALTGSNYTLKIKNLIDRANPSNTMDDYTGTITLSDDIGPSVVEQVMSNASVPQIIILFSEAMDKSSILDKSNYAYKGGDDEFHELPVGASIEAGGDNKSAIISFPRGYQIKIGGWATSYDIRGIRVANVKDIAGNVMERVVDYKDVVAANQATSKPSYVANSFKLYSDSTKVYAEFELDQMLSLFYVNDFRVAGRIADTGYISKNKVVLNFTNSESINAIKLGGPDVRLSTVSTSSKNVAGVQIEYISGETVYDDEIAPGLLSVYASDTGVGDDVITLKFSEAIDDSVVGSYLDDFVFLGGGTGLKVKYATVSYDSVKYYFNADSLTRGQTVLVKALDSSINIRDLKDKAGNQNIYAPSMRDKTGISCIVE